MIDLIIFLALVLVIGGVVTFVILNKKKRDVEREVKKTVQSSTSTSTSVDENSDDNFCLGPITPNPLSEKHRKVVVKK